MKKMKKNTGVLGRLFVVTATLGLMVVICTAAWREDVAITKLRVLELFGLPGETATVTVRTDLAVSGTVSAVTINANNVVSTNLTSSSTGVAAGFEVGGALIVGTTSTLTGLVTAVANIQANGDIYGDDATVISNTATIYTDTVLPDGGTTLVLGASGDTTRSDGALTVTENLTANGNLYGDDATVVSNIASVYADSILPDDGATLALGVAGDTVAVGGAVTIAQTLGITGVATFTVAPKCTVTNVPGAVVAADLVLPTGTTTNAVMLTVTVGAVNYVVPIYALP